MTKQLDNTSALASHRLSGPYMDHLVSDPRKRSPEYSMSKPGYVRETGCGDECLSGANAELNKK